MFINYLLCIKLISVIVIHIMDPTEYSSLTSDIYEILATFYVDIFYNKAYGSAVNLKNDPNIKINSITDGYRHTLLNLSKNMNPALRTFNKKHYETFVKDLCHWFDGWDNLPLINTDERIIRIISEFIPQNYIKSLAREQMYKLLNKILTTVFIDFIEIIADKYIKLIIDYHTNEENIQLLKEEVLGLLHLQRQNWFSEFLKKNTKRSADMVDKSIAIKLQSQLKETMAKNKQLVNTVKQMHYQLSQPQTDNQKTLDKFKQVIVKYKKLDKQLQGALAENSILKQKNKKLMNKYNELDTKFNNFKKWSIRPAPVVLTDETSYADTRAEIEDFITTITPRSSTSAVEEDAREKEDVVKDKEEENNTEEEEKDVAKNKEENNDGAEEEDEEEENDDDGAEEEDDSAEEENEEEENDDDGTEEEDVEEENGDAEEEDDVEEEDDTLQRAVVARRKTNLGNRPSLSELF